MLAAKGEKLRGEDRGPARRVADFTDVLFDLALHLEFVEEQIAVAEDRGEKIIEIVGDAAGQLTKRLHLLRAHELVLQLFARGHIHEGADETNGRASRVPDDQRAFEQVPIGTVAVAEPIFARPMIAVSRESVADAGGGAGPILRVDLLLPEADALGRGGSVISEERVEALRPVERAGFYIPIPNSIIRSPGNDRKMFRARSRAAFRKIIVSFMSFLWMSEGGFVASDRILRDGFVSLKLGC